MPILSDIAKKAESVKTIIHRHYTENLPSEVQKVTTFQYNGNFVDIAKGKFHTNLAIVKVLTYVSVFLLLMVLLIGSFTTRQTPMLSVDYSDGNTRQVSAVYSSSSIGTLIFHANIRNDFVGGVIEIIIPEGYEFMDCIEMETLGATFQVVDQVITITGVDGSYILTYSQLEQFTIGISRSVHPTISSLAYSYTCINLLVPDMLIFLILVGFILSVYNPFSKKK